MYPPSIEVIVLGTAQDGGIPQMGCDCPTCRATQTESSRGRYVSSLGLVDADRGEAWVVDASPDLRQQLRFLWSVYPGVRLAGILLTHAHMGHYLGLAYLGKESWNTRHLPVYCTARMAIFLQSHQPWMQLCETGNITLSIVASGQPVELGAELTVLPISVPHRDELSDTVAYRLSGPARSLIFCPDIDRWEGQILVEIRDADLALLDGTFFCTDELPHRDVSVIPHPFVSDAIKQLRDIDTQILFTHLNHSNRLLADHRLLEDIRTQGFDIAAEGQRLQL